MMIRTEPTLQLVQSLWHSFITAVCNILQDGGGGGGINDVVAAELGALHVSEIIDTADPCSSAVHAPSTVPVRRVSHETQLLT